jgi:RNA polymerase sigma factor (sigma-70 family)
MQAFNQELLDSGELVETRGLSAPVHTRRVQLREGVPVATDGPYAEAEEVLAGYWVVECDSFDRATEIAARLTICPGPERIRAARTWMCGRSTSTSRDATQEALLAASMQWPQDGLPGNPRGWLITVASRRLTDLLRSEQARRQREDMVARWALTERGAPRPDEPPAADTGDTLVLLLLCCHPSLSAASQIALTLRAVGGLSTAEIARALLGSEQTVTRRITRAKQAIKDSGVPFALPAPDELEGRLNRRPRTPLRDGWLPYCRS